MASVVEGGWLSGKKTYIVAAVGAIGVVAGYLTGEVSLTGMVAGLWASWQSVNIRLGVTKSAL